MNKIACSVAGVTRHQHQLHHSSHLLAATDMPNTDNAGHVTTVQISHQSLVHSPHHSTPI